MESKGVEVLLYEDKGHRSFTGRHAYFHDPDGNAIEFIDYPGRRRRHRADYQGRERRAQIASLRQGASVRNQNHK